MSSKINNTIVVHPNVVKAVEDGAFEVISELQAQTVTIAGPGYSGAIASGWGFPGQGQFEFGQSELVPLQPVYSPNTSPGLGMGIGTNVPVPYNVVVPSAEMSGVTVTATKQALHEIMGMPGYSLLLERPDGTQYTYVGQAHIALLVLSPEDILWLCYPHGMRARLIVEGLNYWTIKATLDPEVPFNFRDEFEDDFLYPRES